MTPLRALALCCLALAGCGGATADPGLELFLRVRGAQLVRAPFPSDGAGPAVTFLDVRAPRVTPGDGAVQLGGRTAGGTYALNLGLDREDAYWVLGSGLPDSEVPGELFFQALLDFSRALEPGPFALKVQAVDGEGRPGATLTGAFEALPLYPPGELVFTLEWDADVDADLYVEDPAGVLLGGKNVNTWSPPPPGSPPQPPDAWTTGGTLDFDSNANCTIDGRRRENAVWTSAAPQGHYKAFAALARTCGLGSTRFVLSARRQGAVVGTAQGVLYASDARNDPTAPATSPGVLALELDL